MNARKIHSQEEKPGWSPSNSTYASFLGGAIATVIAGILHAFNITVDATTAAALATTAAAVIGYFFNGGRE